MSDVYIIMDSMPFIYPSLTAINDIVRSLYYNVLYAFYLYYNGLYAFCLYYNGLYDFYLPLLLKPPLTMLGVHIIMDYMPFIYPSLTAITEIVRSLYFNAIYALYLYYNRL